MRCTKCSVWSLLFFALAIFTLTFCSQPEEPVGAIEDLPSSIETKEPEATNDTVSEESDEEAKPAPIQKRSRFFDHLAFKKTKGGSNSGNAGKYEYWDTPGDTGIFYRYMLFNTPRNIPEGQRFHDCQMVVYKLTGKPGYYSDTNEVLVEMYCAFSDPDLGKLDIVGKHLDEIKADFRAPAYSNDGIYAYELGDGYTLVVNNDPVTAFRLIRFKDKLPKQAIDESFNR